MTSEAFFQDPVVSQQCLNIVTITSYGGLGSAVSSPSGVWGRAPASKAFFIPAAQKTYIWWQQLWLFSSAETRPFEAKNCHPHQLPS